MGESRKKVTRRAAIGLSAGVLAGSLVDPFGIEARSASAQEASEGGALLVQHALPLEWYSTNFQAKYRADLPISYFLRWPPSWSRTVEIELDLDEALVDLEPVMLRRSALGRDRIPLERTLPNRYQGQFTLPASAAAAQELRVIAHRRDLYPKENLGARPPMRLRITDPTVPGRHLVVEVTPSMHNSGALWGAALYPFFGDIEVRTKRGDIRQYRFPAGVVIASTGPDAIPTGTIDFAVDAGYVTDLTPVLALIDGEEAEIPPVRTTRAGGSFVFSVPTMRLAPGSTYRLDMSAKPRPARRRIRDIKQATVVFRDGTIRQTGRSSGADLTGSGMATVPGGAEGEI